MSKLKQFQELRLFAIKLIWQLRYNENIIKTKRIFNCGLLVIIYNNDRRTQFLLEKTLLILPVAIAKELISDYLQTAINKIKK